MSVFSINSQKLTSTLTRGRFMGVGVGPGDPELITLKALRAIVAADVISYISNAQGVSQAKAIAIEALSQVDHQQQEIPLIMPMSTDRRDANQVYDAAAENIATHLAVGRSVVFLCEGDPLFFGSFAYLLDRLQSDYECQVVPGISSVNAAASALKRPLTMLKESFAVVSGRHSDAHLRNTLLEHDSVVIMKAGRARPKILAALAATERLADASYLENIGRDDQQLWPDLTTLADEPGPYFSLFVITRRERSHR